jgi:hypothetical protein
VGQGGEGLPHFADEIQDLCRKVGGPLLREQAYVCGRVGRLAVVRAGRQAVARR